MADDIIRVEGLGKKFIIGHQAQEKYSTLRDVMTRNVRNGFKRAQYLLRKNLSSGSETKEEFWALRDVAFNIKQGDRVGIVGRNGAGKSTLLKILSRITEPTEGRITIRGRVASLLEVGTGFHPELSGRENIFLNGAILGMSRNEIRKKFDEIVAFAEVEKFLDTPVKRYSSGMYVRLAFSVAAHLEPEILVVDEVLAVGDAQFQEKCLGKMEDVSVKQGRTVLFVSHNMGVIHRLCSSAIVLKSGNIIFNGNTQDAIDMYVNNVKNVHHSTIERSALLKENHFVKVYTTDITDTYKQEYRFDDDIYMLVQVHLPNWKPSLELALSAYDKYKRRIFTIHEPLNRYYNGNPDLKFQVKIPGNFLTPGSYSWIMCINHPGYQLFDLQDDVCSFSILETGSDFAQYEKADYGCVFVKHTIKLL